MSDEPAPGAQASRGGPVDRAAHVPSAVREAVARALQMAPQELDGDRDLYELGLDSLMLMALAGEWRRGGSVVTFKELTSEPTLNAWTRLDRGEGP